MEGETIVVKFARRYSRQAHELLAGISLAPKLLHYEVIEGAGIHFVVMEYLVTTSTVVDALKGEGRAMHIGSLRKANPCPT